VARPAPPSDDGSPARLIATMVGIVGILLLGSLAWSAVGALLSAVGSASSALSSAAAPPPPSTLAPVAAVTPVVAGSPTLAAPTPTLEVAVVVSPTAAATPAPSPSTTPTAVVAGRNPWILLPQPEPGAKISPGPIVLEARGRGDAPITAMRLELDGAALQVALEQRSESTWRGAANTRVSPGTHTARATVTDADGRTGSFRWTFTAAPAP
jgi:hypothetical protein